jgi:hypothetical protein
MKRLFNFWVRWQACKMTATVLKTAQTEDGLAPYLWSLTVFFENYMHQGSEGTFEDFGPKEPPKLAALKAKP